MRKTIKIASFLVIILACTFRFYNLSSFFQWGMDEEYWGYISYNIATFYHLPLIGGNIGGTGFHTSPWFVYLVSPLYFISHGNPLFLAFSASLLGVVTAFLVFWLGRKMLGIKSALLAAVAYAGSMFIVLSDRRFWNPTVLPICTLLVIYFLWKPTLRNIIFLGLTVAFALSAHGSALILFLVGLIFLIKSRTKLLIYLAIVIASQIPVALFEIKHNFVQTKDFLDFAAGTVNRPALFFSYLSRIFYYPDSLNLAKLYLGSCPAYVKQFSWPAIGAVFTILAVSLVKIKTKVVQISLLIIFLNFLGFVAFPGGQNDYYVLVSFVPIVLLTGAALSKLKFLLPLLFALWLYVNLIKLTSSFHPFSYSQKLTTVKNILQTTSGKPFSLTIESADSCQIYGFRYLFTTFRKDPVESYMDPFFLWLYDRRLPKAKPSHHVQIQLVPGN